MSILSGSDFANLLLSGAPGGKPLAGVERENAVLHVFDQQGLSPLGGGSIFPSIKTSQVIAGKTRTLKFFVSPLPAAIGSGDDFFLLPCWPWTYQAMASQIDCVLPTRKLCLLVAQASHTKIEPHPYDASKDGGKANETSARFVESNLQCLKDLSKVGWNGGIVSGLKKDVVIGPGLNGSKVAIFGWFHAAGSQDDSSAGRWQPYSTIHESTYSDYSHGWRVILNRCVLDGQPSTLKSICNDKVLHPLISDQGPFPLDFPNSFPAEKSPAGLTSATKPKTGLSLSNSVEKVKILASAAAGAGAGFLVGGPVGAMFGAGLGAAIGRAK